MNDLSPWTQACTQGCLRAIASSPWFGFHDASRQALPCRRSFRLSAIGGCDPVVPGCPRQIIVAIAAAALDPLAGAQPPVAQGRAKYSFPGMAAFLPIPSNSTFIGETVTYEESSIKIPAGKVESY